MAAGNELEIVIRARDGASAVLGTIKGELKSFANAGTRDMGRFQQATDSARGGIQALSSAVAAAGGGALLSRTLGDAVGASNRLENALTGLSSIANALGSSAGAANQAAKQLAADGLMTVTEAATGLKNLLAAGFSLDQSIVLMNRFKDSAAFGRQSALGFGEAIAGATEGIKNGNSILVDNAGVTKNLSVMLEEAGYSAQDLMKASTDAGVRQAIFNGVVRETNAQLGDAQRLSANFAGQQAQLSTAVTNTQARLGDLLKVGLLPVVQGAAQFIQANQSMIVSAVAAGAAFVAIVTGVLAAVSAVTFLVSVMNPLTAVLLAVAAIAGVVVFNAFQKMQGKFKDTIGQFGKGAGDIKKKAQDGFGAAGKAAQDMAEKLRDIDENMARAARDFIQSLTEIVRNHQTKLRDLTRDVEREKVEFAKNQAEKAADFKAAQDEMTRDHQERIGDLQKDLDAELLKGRFADAARVSDLQMRIQREKDEYARGTAQKQAEYERDTANAKAQNDQKVSALQAQLNEEKAFLDKHRADVNLVRGQQALDEIEKLRQSHSDQLAQFAKQKDNVITNARQTTQGMANQFNALPGLVNQAGFGAMGQNMGRQMANAFKQALLESLRELPRTLWNLMVDSNRALADSLNRATRGAAAATLPGAILNILGALPKFASGVQNFQGGAAIVGERGPELVTLPRGSNVYPADQTRDLLGGGRSVVVNQTNHNYTEYDYRAAAAELGWAVARA